MKLGTLRKIYPYINIHKKNVKWRQITDAELDFAMQEKQVIANCYDEAVRYALSATKKGREVLKSRIKVAKTDNLEPAYKITLNIKGKDEIYRADQEDYYWDCWDIYQDYYGGFSGFMAAHEKRVPLSLAFNVVVSKMIAKYPMMKPLVSRIYLFPIITNRKCERNRPSNAFRWYTGKEPRSIGETDLALSMAKHKNEVTEVLDNFAPEKDCFVLLTGFYNVKKSSKWHCLPIVGVDKDQKKVEVLDKRLQARVTYSYDQIIQKFKGLIGQRFE